MRGGARAGVPRRPQGRLRHRARRRGERPLSRLATPEGTAAYAREHPAGPGHWRKALGLTLSSIGFGSYLGEESAEADARYAEAFAAGLRGGVNVLDTAANYRAQRSERAVGAAIRAAGVPRERFLVATKGGFVPLDAEDGRAFARRFREAYVDAGVARPEDLVAGCHVMTAPYLAHELSRSLRNLGLDAVDVYFVHNPETQLEAGVPRPAFEARLREVFAMLEERRRQGRVGVYGLATWGGFRRPPGHPHALSLARALEIAREAGGEDHGFRAAELPFSLAMPDAGRAPTQAWNGRTVPFLRAAREAGLLVLGSASLMQGRLARGVPDAVRARLGAPDALAAALQFARSAPGLTSALVGTGRPDHARANLGVLALPAAPDAAADLLGGEGAYPRG
ncbi:MAG TPA: aldo/keto reductase [Candidatus Thermoplasmatota archaeon]|nr:aldo/keto reductase [Candidatus Thermoplasmatota archaeon]